MQFSIIKTAIDSGLSVGIFGLCVWMVITIVKDLCGTMNKLTTRMEIFMTRVRDEHIASAKQHESMMKQHEGMIETLGRINGYKKD